MRQWRATLGSSTDRHRQTAKLCKKPPVAVHHRSTCSGVKALRNTSAAKRQAAKPWLAFRSLDPFRALREPDRRRRDEERPVRSEQRTGNKPKRLLDRKSPIQVVQTIGSRGYGRLRDRSWRPYSSKSHFAMVASAGPGIS